MSKQNNINKNPSEKGINSNNLNDIEDGEIINDLLDLRYLIQQIK